jgi:hypothetical protein
MDPAAAEAAITARTRAGRPVAAYENDRPWLPVIYSPEKIYFEFGFNASR